MELSSLPTLPSLQISQGAVQNISIWLNQGLHHLLRKLYCQAANQWQIAPQAGHNKVVIDPASPRTSVQALLEARSSPCGVWVSHWGTPFFMGWQKYFILHMGVLRILIFLQGELRIPSWLEGSVYSHFSTSDRLPDLQTAISGLAISL